MADQTANILDSIKKTLREEPLSISDISEKAKINWRTAENNLQILKSLNLVFEKKIKNTRTFFYREKNNYFDLPVKNKDVKKIDTIYYYIRKFCQKFYEKEPTKTQAYKIMWKLNKKLKLNLPVGWYMFGPLCIQKYLGEEKEVDKVLDKKVIIEIGEVTKKYCDYNTSELQIKIYGEDNEKLYQTRMKLTKSNFSKEDKKELNLLLMDLIKHAPSETIEIITDFARATLLLGIEETRDLFNDTVWKYIALVRLRDSLKKYYDQDYLDVYLKESLEDIKKEAQLLITNLVHHTLKCRKYSTGL